MKFRYLQPDEIECRPATATEKGLSLLLYKDARCDQRLLDETVGPFNWQRKHEEIGGRLYCTVSIKDPETGEWISKQDVGTESYTEKEKGQASDSFKRACFNWGCGRELYSAPFIWISSKNVSLEKGSNGKYYCKDTLAVQEIEYNNGKICRLVIAKVYKDKKTVVYNWTEKESEAAEEPHEIFISEVQEKALTARCQNEGVSVTWLCEKYKVNDFSELTIRMYTNINEHWNQILEGSKK